MEPFAAARRTQRAAIFAALLGVCLLSGCKVLTVEEDRALRARRGGDFDAGRYVAEVWAAKARPLLAQKAVPAQSLIAAVGGGLDAAGAQLGRQVSEGSAWTFVVQGTGTVAAVDAASRRGSAEVTLDSVSPARTIRIQTGPVVSGTAVRDALPFVAFNDFADQLAFADVGRALTERALQGVKPALAGLRPGQRVRFTGALNLRAADEPLVLTPVEIAPVGS